MRICTYVNRSCISRSYVVTVITSSIYASSYAIDNWAVLAVLFLQVAENVAVTPKTQKTAGKMEQDSGTTNRAVWVHRERLNYAAVLTIELSCAICESQPLKFKRHNIKCLLIVYIIHVCCIRTQHSNIWKYELMQINDTWFLCKYFAFQWQLCTRARLAKNAATITIAECIIVPLLLEERLLWLSMQLANCIALSNWSVYLSRICSDRSAIALAERIFQQKHNRLDCDN